MANSMLCEGVPMDRSRIIWLVAVSVAFGSIAIIAIGLRTYTKLLITKKISWDDWTILGAGILLAAVLGLNFFSTHISKLIFIGGIVGYLNREHIIIRDNKTDVQFRRVPERIWTTLLDT